MVALNPDFKPPADYKPPATRVSDKVMIPQDEYPEINFVGLLIGPRGNTLKNIEKECNAKIMIRGKGSVKEGKVGRKDGQMLPGEDEPLHALVTANTMENVKKAVEQVCGEPRRKPGWFLLLETWVMAPSTLTSNCCCILIDQKHPEAGY